MVEAQDGAACTHQQASSLAAWTKVHEQNKGPVYCYCHPHDATEDMKTQALLLKWKQPEDTSL
jgi:hypothetical protein